MADNSEWSAKDYLRFWWGKGKTDEEIAEAFPELIPCMRAEVPIDCLTKRLCNEYYSGDTYQNTRLNEGLYWMMEDDMYGWERDEKHDVN